jgi:hypothetical protein
VFIIREINPYDKETYIGQQRLETGRKQPSKKIYVFRLFDVYLIFGCCDHKGFLAARCRVATNYLPASAGNSP